MFIGRSGARVAQSGNQRHHVLDRAELARGNDPATVMMHSAIYTYRGSLYTRVNAIVLVHSACRLHPLP